jgi:H+/Cl- antiporter ClcA
MGEDARAEGARGEDARGAVAEHEARAAAIETAAARPVAGAGLRSWLSIVVLAALFAVPAALIAGAFIVGMGWLTHLLWDSLPAAVSVPAPVLLVGVPTAAGLAVGLLIRYAPGHAGPDPADEHGLGGTPGALRDLPGTVAAAFASLAGGASLGPEAPLVGILGTVGGAVARALRLPAQAGMTLGMAGLASVLGGIFGNPLAIGLMMVEASPVVGRDLYLRIVPALVAATVGVYVFAAILGGPFAQFHFAPYPGFAWWHLVAAVGVGAGGGIVGLGFIRLAQGVRRVLAPLHDRPVAKAILGGLAIGLVALAFGELTLFSGEHELGEVTANGEAMGLAALLLLAVGKAIASAVSLSAGFRGGRIFPILFLGGVLGMALHVAVPALPAALTVACGMAGTGVSLFRYPLFLTAMLVMFNAPETLPLMLLASLASWVVVDGRAEL